MGRNTLHNNLTPSFFYMEIGKMKAYKINWSWDKNTDNWLRHQIKGFTLNICSGKSTVGNIRADLDKSLKPNIICDVKHLPFQDHVFDTVICDPPFSMYNSFKWVHTLSLLARKRIILSHPLFNLNLKGGNWIRQFLVTSQHGNFLRLWSIHDKNEL